MNGEIKLTLPDTCCKELMNHYGLSNKQELLIALKMMFGEATNGIRSAGGNLSIELNDD